MDWVILDVVIGLSFLFFLVSLVAAAINEAIAGIFKLRARMLEQGIVSLIGGTRRPATGSGELDIVRRLYEHSLVNGFSRGGSKPSYLASRSFRNALFDITGLLEATTDPGDPLRADEVKATVDAKLQAIPNPQLQETLTAIWNSCHNDATEFRAGVERWFDRGMERVTGWYKRRTQVMLFVLGLGVAVALNVSALSVADELWRTDGVRDALVAQVENQPGTASGAAALERLQDLEFPVGWHEAIRPDSGGAWAVAVVGWLLTGFAVTFGAPFWFDVLGRFANLRAAGRKPADVLTAQPAPRP